MQAILSIPSYIPGCFLNCEKFILSGNPFLPPGRTMVIGIAG